MRDASLSGTSKPPTERCSSTLMPSTTSTGNNSTLPISTAVRRNIASCVSHRSIAGTVDPRVARRGMDHTERGTVEGGTPWGKPRVAVRGRRRMSEEISQVLSSSDALADLPVEAVTALAEAARERTLRAGDVLFEAGSPADGMVVIARGRLGVLDPDGHVIATMGRGDVVGEMGALTGERRSNQVVALRDTTLMELDQAGFDRVFESSHVVGRALSRLVIDRLVGDDDERGGKTVPTTVAVVTVGAGRGVDQLVDALEHSVGAAAVVGADLARGRSDGEILTALETAENDHDLVVPARGRRRGR